MQGEKMTGFYVREIEHEGKLDAVNNFVKDMENSERAKGFHTAEEFEEINPNYIKNLAEAISENEKLALKSYTGLGYKYINQVEKGIWNYDLLGPKTAEKELAAIQSSELISSAIKEAPELNGDFLTFRGTNLENFRGYNVNSVADLKKLEGNFFLEEGFTSTSLVREKNFANREMDDPLRPKNNIEITYHVAGKGKGGVALLSSELSYSPEQAEFLLDKNTLNFVSNVEISDDQKSAKMDYIVVPRMLYES